MSDSLTDREWLAISAVIAGALLVVLLSAAVDRL
jgi:hypothetical protein